MGNSVLLTAGVVCIIAAIVGGGLKAFGAEVPALASVRRQLLLGSSGVVLLALGLLDLSHIQTNSAAADNPVSNGSSGADRPGNESSQTRGDDEMRQNEPGPPGNSQNPNVQALRLAWGTYDALLASVRGQVQSHEIRAGSPRALRLAMSLNRMRDGLNSATNALRVGDTQEYSNAMAIAQQASEEATRELADNNAP